MQSLFEISFTTDRACFHEFGEVMAQKAKVRRCFWILGGVLAALMLLLIFLGGYREEVAVTTLFFVGFLLIYATLYGRLLGNGSYRSSSIGLVDAPVNYRFEEDVFYSYAPLMSGSYRYELITEIVESDKLFVLFVGKGAAHLLPKAAFSPESLLAFREFITRRTGKWIRRVNTGRRTAMLVAAIVLTAALCVAGVWGVNRPQTMQVGEYAITLPADFEVDEWTEYDLEAYNYDVGVQVCSYGGTYMEEQLGEDPSSEMVLRWLMNDTPGISSATYGKLENGDPYVTYRWTSEEGFVWYYQSSVTQGDGLYWLTEMYCYEEGTAQYAESFLQWGSTVTIQELEHEYVW